MAASAQPKQDHLASRKLRDIQELTEKPYPGIKVHIDDDNLEKACLILSPPGARHLHLTIEFPADYPLIPPKVSIQSEAKHPNVFGSYICATILNLDEDYTSAYTLKSICIQILSFFASKHVEDVHLGGEINLSQYREQVEADNRYFQSRYGVGFLEHGVYKCTKCGFGVSGAPSVANPIATAEEEDITPPEGCSIAQLPFEVLLEICDYIETDNLVMASKAWNGFLNALHRLVPVRNLQCFTLKKGTRAVNLGVGVDVAPRNAFLSCEFDWISDEAFQNLGVRRSIQGLRFNHWLPLAFNAQHWSRVKGSLLQSSLRDISEL